MWALYTPNKAAMGRKTPFTLFLQRTLRPKGHAATPEESAMQALNIAAAGMMNAQGRFEASARRTAAAPLDHLGREIVERIQARTAFSANAAVVRTADDMTGTLLDMLA